MNDAGWKGLGQSEVASREALLRKAQGLVAETFPYGMIASISSTTSWVSGTLYASQILLLAGDLISAAHMVTAGTAGTVPTFSKMGLFDSGGALARATADQVGAWGPSGVHSQNLLTPYSVPTTGIYYLGMLALFAGNPPPFGVMHSGSTVLAAGLGAGIAGKPLYNVVQTGLSDLPGSMTLALGALANAPWMALSGSASGS